jgi:hypothetical protein
MFQHFRAEPLSSRQIDSLVIKMKLSVEFNNVTIAFQEHREFVKHKRVTLEKYRL